VAVAAAAAIITRPTGKIARSAARFTTEKSLESIGTGAARYAGASTAERWAGPQL